MKESKLATSKNLNSLKGHLSKICHNSKEKESFSFEKAESLIKGSFTWDVFYEGEQKSSFQIRRKYGKDEHILYQYY